MPKEEKSGTIGAFIETSKNAKCQSKKLFNINKKMLPYKIHFFLFIGASGAVLPYLVALAQNLGITATSLGIVYTTHQFSCIFTKTIIGYLTDYFNKLKAILIGLTFIQATFFFLLLTIPKIDLREIMKDNSSSLQVSRDKFNLCGLCSEHKESNWINIKKFNYKVLAYETSCIEFTQQPDSIYCPPSKTNFSHLYTKTATIKYTVCNIDDMNISLSNINISSEYKIVVHHMLPMNTQDNTTFSKVIVLCSDSGSLYKIPNNNSTPEYILNACLSPKSNDDALLPIINIDKFPSHNIYCKFFANPKSETDNVSIGEITLGIFRTYQYWMYGVFLIISLSCTSALFTLADTACYENIEIAGGDFGRTRVWGAVSWGISAPFAGYLNDITEGFLAAWCLMAIFTVLQLWNISRMNLRKPHFSQNILKDIRKILSSTEFLSFEFGVFMNGLSTSLSWFYLTWFLVTIGSSRLLIGLVHTVQCFLGDVPFLFCSGWLIKKMGHFNIVTLALLAYSLRFIVYSYIHNPWFILPVETLHGFTSGAFYAAMRSYAKISSELGTEATTQSLLCSTFEGLGTGIGCILGGLSVDHFGGHITFFYGGIFSACFSVVNIALTLLIKTRKGRIQITNKAIGLTSSITRLTTSMQ